MTTMYRKGILLLALIFMVSGMIPAQNAFAKKSKKKSWNLKKDVNVELKYSPTYDSNVLDLSDNDIDRFETHNLNFITDVETYDDFIQNVGVKVSSYSPRWIGNRRGFISYSLGYSLHTKNSFNDRAIHSLYASHDLAKGLDVIGSYLLIPQRYFRDFYDKDYKEVFASNFMYELGGFGLKYTPSFAKKFTFSGRYEIFNVFYNSYFTEYDVDGYGVRFDVRYKLNRRTSATMILKRRWADNFGYVNGYDVAIEEGVDTEYGDGSYGEEWFEFILKHRTKKIMDRRWNLNLNLRLRHRFYTSDLPLIDDPYHRGREHMLNRVLFKVDTKIVKGLSGGPSVTYEWRKTESPTEAVPIVKDYNGIKYGFELVYKLW